MDNNFSTLLDQLVKGNVENELVEVIFKKSSDIAFRLIEDFQSSFNSNNSPRFFIPNNSELSQISKSNFQKVEFIEGEKYILKNKIPQNSTMDYFYFEYSKLVSSHFSMFYNLEIKRKCGLPYVSHLYRVSTLLNELFTENDKRNYYSAISAMHDSIEDIPIKFSKQNDSMNFEYLEKFLGQFIPDDFISDLSILTNIYDLLLSYTDYFILKKDLAFIPKNIINELNLIYSNSKFFKEDIIKLLELVETTTLQDDTLRNLRWEAYIKLYLPRIVEKSKKINNYSLIEIKTIDLLDNAWGIISLDLTGKMRQILKRQNFINLILQADINYWTVKSHIAELQNQTLLDAKNLILEHLNNDKIQLDYFQSALQIAKTLKPVLIDTTL